MVEHRDRFRKISPYVASCFVLFCLGVAIAVLITNISASPAQVASLQVASVEVADAPELAPVEQAFGLPAANSLLLQPTTTPALAVTPLPLLQQPILQQPILQQPTLIAPEPFLNQNLDVARLMAVRAFLRGAIHYAEGTYPNPLGVSPYKIILGQETFEDFNDHPRRLITLNWGTPYEVTSDAAGACQFTSEIWDQLHQKYPDVWRSDLPAFHPQNQDIGCLILWTEVGGYKELMAGTSVNDQGTVMVDVERFTNTVHASCTIWASFPCQGGTGAYAQAHMGYQQAKAIEEIWRNFLVVLDDEQRLIDFVETSLDQRLAQTKLLSGRGR
jgi:muramidase (phage lysozyme)